MRAVIEAASLVDALNSAVRIAPERGQHFEMCQGVLLEVEDDHLLITALDGAVTWQRRCDYLAISGRPTWRLSSVVAKFITKLEIANNESVEIEDIEHDRIRVTSGTMRGEFATLDPYSYPRIDIKTNDLPMTTVHNLAARLKQVTFAVSHDETSVLSGVHLNGSQLITCNHHIAVRVPCDISVDEPITAPLAPLTGTLRRSDEIELGVLDSKLVLMPDPDTVITSVIIEYPYPETDRLWKMTEPCDQWIELDAGSALSVLTRILVLCKADQYPTCEVTFTHDAMVFDMIVPELGRVTDEAPCTASIDEPFTMKFSPRDLQPALAAAGGVVQLRYQKNPLKPVRIDGHEYSCVMMPKAK
jgi:DNA polymerase III sliding clamp (beta) subunit (PCNA family)